MNRKTKREHTIEKLRKMAEDTSSPFEAEIAKKRLALQTETRDWLIDCKKGKTLPKWYRYLLRRLLQNHNAELLCHYPERHQLKIRASQADRDALLDSLSDALSYIESDISGTRSERHQTRCLRAKNYLVFHVVKPS